ncbi:MAG: hypothetical protein KGJ24_12465 [Burkholderiales bacterium]|nr:hypothetical protein [Burkholderiales bacterium]
MPLVLKSVPAARGPRWIADAFRLYARRPLGFSALFVVFLFAALGVSVVPLLGPLLQMMSLPLLSLGFMVAGQSALLGGPVHPRQFIEPLRGDPARRRALLTLCVVYGLAAVAVLLLADALSHHAWDRLQGLLAKGETAQGEVDALLAEPGIAAGLLTAGLGGMLLSAPFWHAPALVHWGGQGVRQALFSSTLAVWRTKGAFCTYLLGWLGVLLLFGFVSAIVLGLAGAPQLTSLLGVPAGLVFSTAFYLSVLFTFNDSFGNAGAASAADRPPPGAV